MLVAVVVAACIPDCSFGNVVATTLDYLVVTKPPLHSGREVITGLSCPPGPKGFKPAPPVESPIKLVVVYSVAYTRMPPCTQSL